MIYEARLSKKAVRDLDSVEPLLRRRIIQKMEELQDDPFPRGAVMLQGRKNILRVRVGDHRILYEVLRKERIVLIEKIDHRSTVYGP